MRYVNDMEMILNRIFSFQLLGKCIIPQAGVLPSIMSALLPKIAAKVPAAKKAPKASISRGPKKAAKTTTGVTSKPALKKKGQGSFSVLGEPKSKVGWKTNGNLFEFVEHLFRRWH